MFATIQIPDDWTPDLFREILGVGFHIGPARSVELVFLDTFDWRLASRGSRLERETCSGKHVLNWTLTNHDPVYSLPVQVDPIFAADLPEGFLRAQLAPLLGVRALMDVGSCRLRRRVAGMRDRHGNSRVHIHLERVKVLARSGKPSGSQLSLARVSGLPGLEAVFNQTVDRLASLHPRGREQLDLLKLAAAAGGRTVGDYGSKFRGSLNPDQPAETALRFILLDLLRKLVANVDGTLRDLDTEFLHDLRVASRRTRAAVTQIKGVLPKDQTEPFIKNLKWLGKVTGPCRDLDVQLRAVRKYQRTLPETGESLDPVVQVIEHARNQAHTNVCKCLRSARFEDMIRDWGAFLEDPTSAGSSSKALRPIREIASKSVLKAYRRIVARGEGLGDDPPVRTMHRLRIDAKNLRYLLEFFRSLWADQKVGPLIRQLKAVQDALGGFNDMEVQQNRLRTVVCDLTSTRKVDAPTLSAVDRMTAECRARQKTERRSFTKRFDALISPKTQARYQSLFGSEA